jgi:hypothetical protein
MRTIRFLTLSATLTASAFAQEPDQVTLSNKDVLTGKVKAMADGKLVITSPVLGDVTVPMANVEQIVTKEPIQVRTKADTTASGRILGIEGGALKLDGEVPSVALDNLAMINPPVAPAPAWTGTLKVTGLYATGNTDRRAMGLALDAVRRSDVDRITFDASWDYAEDKKDPDNDPSTSNIKEWDLTQRRTGGGLKYDYFLTKRWYALVTTRVLGDTLANLDLRASRISTRTTASSPTAIPTRASTSPRASPTRCATTCRTAPSCCTAAKRSPPPRTRPTSTCRRRPRSPRT